MGCDIHPVIEIADVDYDGQWEPVAIPDNSRCYRFFAALAGVRAYDERPPIFPPRGLPKMGLFTDKYLSGEHSATWFTLAEMEAYDASWLNEPDNDAGWDLWQRWLRIGRFYAAEYGVTPDKVRYVMDFDS